MIKTTRSLSVLLCGIALIGFSSHANASELTDYEISEGEFKMAKVIFPISDISQDGKYVTLTINKDARSLEAKSKTVDYSVMHRTGTSSEKCPLVNSTSIDKNIKSYNPMTGRAKLDVVFRTEEQAKTAAAADCLLIKDTEVEGEE